LYGTTVVLQPRFEPDAVARALREDEISIVSLVPTMLSRLLEEWGDSAPPSALRSVLVGGGPAAGELVTRGLQMGLPVCPTYGLTEAASQVATECQAPSRLEPGGAGKPLSVTRVRIVDDDGTECAPGVSGEIQVAGPTVMSGYWRDEVSTKHTITEGWLRTGDIGRLDSEGRLWMEARRTDLIVTGGENVYPAEVEAVLDAHPSVNANCVFGIFDPDWGEKIVAAVELRSASGVDPTPADLSPSGARTRGAETTDSTGSSPEMASELEDYVRERIAAYKVPRRFFFLEELPRTSAGKIRREEVKRMALERRD
jgi:O-succinylbenzoic acid--CoA ligase